MASASTSANGVSTNASIVSQPVVFTTQTQYPLPYQKYMIPTTWRRYQLSQLVNKALSLVKPVPFDFLSKGEIIRGSLAEWCSEHGVGEVHFFFLFAHAHSNGRKYRKKLLKSSILNLSCRPKKWLKSLMKTGFRLCHASYHGAYECRAMVYTPCTLKVSIYVFLSLGQIISLRLPLAFS